MMLSKVFVKGTPRAYKEMNDMNSTDFLEELRGKLSKDSTIEERQTFLDYVEVACMGIAKISIDGASVNLFVDEARKIWKDNGHTLDTFDQHIKGKRLRSLASGEEPAHVQKLWPEEVSAEEVIRLVEKTIGLYIDLPEEEMLTASVWVLHTWAYDSSDTFPILNITSPTKGCGKTMLMEVLEQLVRTPKLVSGASTAFIYAIIEKIRPTLLIDEADSFIGRDAEKIGVLNAGWRRGGSYGKTEKVGDKHEPIEVSCWCPKAFAGIGDRPETLTDRGIHITMNKMSANKELATFGLDELREDTEDHRQKLARWAKDNVARLRTKVKHTDVPKDIRSMNSRAFENWRPLFAIADLAGEDLAMRIRDSARFILKKDEGDDWATELLKELHRYFIETGADKIHTEDFVKDLNDQEDGPWVTYCGGFPIKPTNIAKYMKKFQVKSKDVRIGSIVRKGYHLRTVAPVFARYLAPETLQTLQPSNHNEKQPTGKRYNVADTESVALNGKANGTGKHSGVANVADTGQGSGDGLDLPWENPDFGKKEKSSAYNEGLEK